MKETTNDESQRTVAKTESFQANGEEDKGGGDECDSHYDDHKMRRGQGWGKGIVADVKRTILTHWKEEMTNLNGKVSRLCIGSSQHVVCFFLFTYMYDVVI